MLSFLQGKVGSRAPLGVVSVIVAREGCSMKDVEEQDSSNLD